NRSTVGVLRWIFRVGRRLVLCLIVRHDSILVVTVLFIGNGVITEQAGNNRRILFVTLCLGLELPSQALAVLRAFLCCHAAGECSTFVVGAHHAPQQVLRLLGLA